MNFVATKTTLPEIIPLRKKFLEEKDFQIRYHACHERGWSDSYLIQLDDETIGYGSVKGKEQISDRDTIFEFYVLPQYHDKALPAFAALLQAAQPGFIEIQSNELLSAFMLYHYAQDINADVVLFKEDKTTSLVAEGILFRERHADDVIFDHTLEPVGDYVLALAGKVIATGGFTLYYNPPFADLYMEVAASYRRKGYGSFLIQELKKACYAAGRVPAARTSIENTASRQTLLKAGLAISGFMLTGLVKPAAG